MCKHYPHSSTVVCTTSLVSVHCRVPYVWLVVQTRLWNRERIDQETLNHLQHSERVLVSIHVLPPLVDILQLLCKLKMGLQLLRHTLLCVLRML